MDDTFSNGWKMHPDVEWEGRVAMSAQRWTDPAKEHGDFGEPAPASYRQDPWTRGSAVIESSMHMSAFFSFLDRAEPGSPRPGHREQRGFAAAMGARRAEPRAQVSATRAAAVAFARRQASPRCYSGCFPLASLK